MRTTILLCTLLILAGCSSAPQPEVQKAPPGEVHVFQPDSPIIITDGSSIHFSKHNGFTILDPTHIQAVIDTSKQWVFEVMGCVSPPAHACKAALGPGSWTVTLHHTDGAEATKLTWDGATNIVDINAGPGSSISYNGDFSQSGYHLHHVKVKGVATQFDCPPGSAPGPKACVVQIHKQ